MINGNITNLIELEAGAKWSPPDGHIVIQSDTASIGGTYANGAFTAPEQPKPKPFSLTWLAQSALTKTDTTVLRCCSAGVAVPADIQAYRIALRNIATGRDTTSTVLPTQPTDYPVGT